MTSSAHYREPVPPGRRKISRKRGPLSVSDKIEIVYRVLVDHEPQQAVAKERRISLQVVNKLVCKVQRHKELLDELAAKRDEAESRRATIAGVVTEMNQLDTFVDSAQTVRRALEETHQFQTTDAELSLIHI